MGKFKVYTEAEKAAWLRGKIACYYSHKKKKTPRIVNTTARFNNFNASEALNKAFERTYGTK